MTQIITSMFIQGDLVFELHKSHDASSRLNTDACQETKNNNFFHSAKYLGGSSMVLRVGVSSDSSGMGSVSGISEDMVRSMPGISWQSGEWIARSIFGMRRPVMTSSRANSGPGDTTETLRWRPRWWSSSSRTKKMRTSTSFFFRHLP